MRIAAADVVRPMDVKMIRALRLAAGTVAISFLALTGCVGTVFAEDAPRLLNYQGRLTDKATGNPKSGPVTLTFRIYDAATFGSQLPIGPSPWAEEHSNVSLSNGNFSVLLGEKTSFPKYLFDGDPADASGPKRFLEVTVNDGVNTEILSPRRRIVSAPYAVAPEEIGARVALKAGVTGIPFNAETVLTWEVERWDEGNLLDGQSQNLVAPQKGKYMIFATTHWSAGNVSHVLAVKLRLNGNRTLAGQSTTGVFDLMNSVSTVAELEAGDEVSVVVYHNQSGGLNLNGSDSTEPTEFGMMKIP